jgi:hypothetical protein
MNLSEFVSATSHLSASITRETEVLGREFSSKQLTFDMQEQTQSNWCWAATATSVSHFYWSESTWTQCLVANGELGYSNCCSHPVPSACNVPWYLDRAFTRTDNFRSQIGQATFQQVRDEIDAGRLVGARIGWTGGGGHFMVIYGYSLVDGVEYFDIDDPIYGKSHLSVSDFTGNYQGEGQGSWTHTYFTKIHVTMPTRLLMPTEPILQRIAEIRPLLQLKQNTSFLSRATPADAGGAGGEAGSLGDADASLGIAHRVYSIGLNSLLANQPPAPQPVALRVYEVSGNVPRAFFDVSEAQEPRVLQMSASPKYLEPFTRGLEQVLAVLSNNAQEAELKLLRVPSLNFEALWVNYDGDTEDVIVPLRAVGRLTPNQRVTFSEAMNALQEAARPLAQMDDMMGA